MLNAAIENGYLYVITGGPGAGKTKVLEELEQRGYACVPEVARGIIQEQVRTDGDAVPWGNNERYTELMLEGSIASFLAQSRVGQPVFLDRGIPDVLCHARIAGVRPTVRIQNACESYRYNRKVFIAPPWEEIYTTDEERKQSFAEAVRVYDELARIYAQYGYTLIELPKASVIERADFVVEEVEGRGQTVALFGS